MNTTLYLIRHGEVEYELDSQDRPLIYGPDTPLSSQGIAQITQLAEKLKKNGVHLGRIYCSPFVRARQSAEIIALFLGISEIIVNDKLGDIHAPGWIGRTMEELQGIGGNIYEVPPLTEDQETLIQLTDRYSGTIQQLLNINRGITFGVVGHGDPTRVFLDRLLFPDKAIPSITRDNLYYGKGEAWRLIFDPSLKLLEKEIILGESTSAHGPERRIF